MDLARWAVVGSVLAAVFGALVVCALVYAYGFTVADGRRRQAERRQRITRAGHALAGAGFGLAGLLAIVAAWLPGQPPTAEGHLRGLDHRLGAVATVLEAVRGAADDLRGWFRPDGRAGDGRSTGNGVVPSENGVGGRAATRPALPDRVNDTSVWDPAGPAWRSSPRDGSSPIVPELPGLPDLPLSRGAHNPSSSQPGQDDARSGPGIAGGEGTEARPHAQVTAGAPVSTRAAGQRPRPAELPPFVRPSPPAPRAEPLAALPPRPIRAEPRDRPELLRAGETLPPPSAGTSQPSGADRQGKAGQSGSRSGATTAQPSSAGGGPPPPADAPAPVSPTAGAGTTPAPTDAAVPAPPAPAAVTPAPRATRPAEDVEPTPSGGTPASTAPNASPRVPSTLSTPAAVGAGPAGSGGLIVAPAPAPAPGSARVTSPAPASLPPPVGAVVPPVAGGVTERVPAAAGTPRGADRPAAGPRPEVAKPDPPARHEIRPEAPARPEKVERIEPERLERVEKV